MLKGQLLLFAFVCASCMWQEARSSPTRVMGYNSISRDAKIPRTIRAPFRNREMMTARGFGKRSQPLKYKEMGSPWMLNKNEVDAYPLDPVEQMVNESSLESVPIEWMVDELMTSPVLTSTVLSRFVDTNKDGILSANELLSKSRAANSVSAMESNDSF